MLVPVEMMRELVVMFAGNIPAKGTGIALYDIGESKNKIENASLDGVSMKNMYNIIFQNCVISNMKISDSSCITITGCQINGNIVQEAPPLKLEY